MGLEPVSRGEEVGPDLVGCANVDLYTIYIMYINVYTLQKKDEDDVSIPSDVFYHLH